jgi:tetratricopeptide (TPR) repeat protein
MAGADRTQKRQKASAGRDATVVGGDQLIINIADTERAQALAPGLLPRDVPGFTGREHEMERLANLGSGGSVLITAIDGIAGVGKTALAVHAAHQLRLQFPDGQLYVDLRGYTSGQPPAEPSEVLEVFLRSLGVPAGDIPSSVEARSGMLRGVLVSRRVLMLLDNAVSEAQVKPLLPGAGESLVIITSRSTLPGLEADNRISLDVLGVDEATILLTRVIGDERALAEAEAIQQVRECCGDLPLALRIAAQILAVHPTWPVSKLAHLLADERERLDHLAVGDLGVRATFEVSYKHLRGREARTFRLLGLHPGSSFDWVAAGNLVGLSSKAISQALDQLVEACLISELGPGFFAMHDLLRLFAYEICLNKEKKTLRDAAQMRLIKHFTVIALIVAARFTAGLRVGVGIRFDDHTYDATSSSGALDLFDSNRVGMMGVLKVAAGQGWAEDAWKLFEPMSQVLLLTRRIEDLVDASQMVISAARQTGNVVIEKDALGVLGIAYNELGRHDDAIDCYEAALAGLRKEGDRKGEVWMLINIGNALSNLNRWRDAAVNYYDALNISKELGDRRGQAQALANLGAAYTRAQRFDQAIPILQDAVPIFEETDDRRGRGAALINLGIAHRELGQLDQSIELCLDGLTSLKETGDRHTEGMALLSLAASYRQLGRINEAIEVYQTALEVSQSSGDLFNEGRVLAELGDTFYGLRQKDRASLYWLEAAKIAQELGNDTEMARLQKMASRTDSPWRRLWRR